MLCACGACGWTWRDRRPAPLRIARGCARCGAAWGAKYAAWNGRDASGRRVRPTAEVWQVPPIRGRLVRSA